jgi:threonine dehydratase
MTAALTRTKGGPVVLSEIDTFVDGAAVDCVGSLTYPIVRDLVDELVKVPEGAVCTEMLDLYQIEGITVVDQHGAMPSALQPPHEYDLRSRSGLPEHACLKRVGLKWPNN